MTPGSLLRSTMLLLILAPIVRAQSSDVKFIADTLVVEADGTYAADPDLATLTFNIFSQDKDLKLTYSHASEAVERIVALAQKNGIPKDDVSSGILTVRPFYDGDRKKKAKSYAVSGLVTVKVRDFSKIGSILEGSVDDGITDFRSLTYSLSDEEAAKQKAVGEAMRHAVGRASAALAQKGQKVGSLRFANLDVKQLVGVSTLELYSMIQTIPGAANEQAGTRGYAKAAPPPPPLPQPEKITVSATVQCAFQIQ